MNGKGMSRTGAGRFFLIVLLCANILLVAGQQRGRLSTSVRGDKPRWIPRSIPATPTIESVGNSSTSSISGQSADKSKVADIEKDVLPATKSVENAASSSTEDVLPLNITTTATTSTTTTTEQPKEAKVSVEEVLPLNRTARNGEGGKVVVRAENLKDAAAKDSQNEKVPTKRDLPFVIQSSPGLPALSENLLRGFTPIHEERFDDQDYQRPQLLSRSDNDFESNTPQVYLSKPQQQQQNHQQPIAFSSPQSQSQVQAQASNIHQQFQQPHSFNPYSQYHHHQQASQAYHHSPSSSSGGSGSSAAASASHLGFHAPPASYHHQSIHENTPNHLKLNYNPFSTPAQVSFFTAAPSNKFATLAQVQSPYVNYASATSAFPTTYPASTSPFVGGQAATASGQYVGYATTVQPQLVHYQGANGQNLLQQQQQQQQQQTTGLFLGRIPHNQPITDYSYHNPNIIHAHNQNLYSNNFAKVSNPSSVFNQANGQSLYQVSPYTYPVQAAFQVGSASVAPGSVSSVKPYPAHHFQQQQQPTASSLALTGSSPTLATPQYKHYAGAVLSAAAAFNINKNEVSNHLGYGTNGPTIATIKVNPYVPQSFGTVSNGSPYQQQQQQTAAIAFSYAKPITSYGHYQQQSPLHASTYAYTSPTYQQQFYNPQPAASALSPNQHQPGGYFVNAQSFYGSPNKYQSTFGQIGGAPHKVLYASH